MASLTPRRARTGLPALAVAFLPLLAACASAPHGARPEIELLAALELPAVEIDGARLGGLSGLAWTGGHEYLAVTDDKAQHGPARFYRLHLEVESSGSTPAIEARVEGWTGVRGADGGPIGKELTDLEAIASRPSGEIFIASEGWIEKLVSPWIGRFDADGTWRGLIALPSGFAADSDGISGPRSNLSFESLAATPDGRYLFVAGENALLQDGPGSDTGLASPSRMLRYDLTGGRWDGAWVYLVDAPRQKPEPGAYRVSGVVELAALDAGHLLALERAWVRGQGFDVRLYLASIDGAEEISLRPALAGRPLPRAMKKRLLLDFGRLGLKLDNLEGMALGPRLADGRRTLFVVSDDNFKPEEQVNQLLAFAIRVGASE